MRMQVFFNYFFDKIEGFILFVFTMFEKTTAAMTRYTPC